MEKLVYMGEDDRFSYYTLNIMGMHLLFKFNAQQHTLSFDMDSVAWALGYEDAIDMMSDDSMLDFFNRLKKEFGRWPFDDLSIEKNN